MGGFWFEEMRLGKLVEASELKIRNEFSSVKPLRFKLNFKLEFPEKL